MYSSQVALPGKVREEVKELTGTLKDNLGRVVQHGKRADSIVKNMLLHSREGSGERRPVDVKRWSKKASIWPITVLEPKSRVSILRWSDLLTLRLVKSTPFPRKSLASY
jgi:hypothetical protein